MKFIRVYFGRRTKEVVTNGVLQNVVTYIFSSTPTFKASVSIDGVEEQFSVTYWDGQPSDGKKASSKESNTMWLNGLTKEQAYVRRDLYCADGQSCYMQLDVETRSGKLLSTTDFNAKPENADNLVTSEQARAIVSPA